MKNKQNAFTLAEVLITLMVLGIVAALSMPVLQDNINKSVWTNGLKVAKGNVERAFANFMADYSADSLSDTPIWANGEIQYDVGTPCTGYHDEAIYNIADLKKYFKVDSVNDNKTLPYQTYTLSGTLKTIPSNNNAKTFDLVNNSSVYIAIDDSSGVQDSSTAADCGNTICAEYARIYIDVNGKKGPNTFGKDLYRFSLSEHGQLIPYGSEALNKLNSSNPVWTTSCAGKHPEAAWDSESCTARVVEEDYRITY